MAIDDGSTIARSVIQRAPALLSIREGQRHEGRTAPAPGWSDHEIPAVAVGIDQRRRRVAPDGNLRRVAGAQVDRPDLLARFESQAVEVAEGSESYDSVAGESRCASRTVVVVEIAVVDRILVDPARGAVDLERNDAFAW